MPPGQDTQVSEAVPETWTLANHRLFPDEFQEMTLQLLLCRQRLRLRKLRPSQRSIGGLNDLLLSGILRFLSHHVDYTGHAGTKGSTDQSRLKCDVFLTDRMVQPQVDVEGSPSNVLWGKLSGPCIVSHMLMTLPYSSIIGQPVLKPVNGLPSGSSCYGSSYGYSKEEGVKAEKADRERNVSARNATIQKLRDELRT